jgi:hypothetical protein
VKAAATEASDMLRLWLAKAIKRSETEELEISKAKTTQEADWRNWKTGAVFVASAAVLLILGAAWWGIASRRRRPLYFGLPIIQRRLGAPHAGGNRAVFDLGAPPT